MPRETRHGAGHSNVGHGAFYESQDQKNEPQSVINQRQRYEDKKTGPNRTENYSTSKYRQFSMSLLLGRDQ